MSIALIVSLPSRRLPIPEQWQEAITRHGFALELDTDFFPATFTGYLPCKYKGVETGFEYNYEGATSIGAFHLKPDNYQIVEVSFITRSDQREYVAAAIAAAVLADITDGSLEEQQEEKNYSGVTAIEWAREVETELGVELESPREAAVPVTFHTTTKPWWKFW